MRTIPSTDISVYPICLGGNVFGWTADAAESFAILDAYTGAGGNFIDTADGYNKWVPGHVGGESEAIIGEWIAKRGNRAEVVVATKVATHPQFRGLSPQNIVAACDASLKRLGIDQIDLYYAHFDDESQIMPDIAEAFDSLVKAGKIRAVGMSNLSKRRMISWLDVAEAEGFARPVAIQTQYSLAYRTEFETGYQQLALTRDMATFPYYALASGFLSGKYRSEADLAGKTRGERVRRFATPAGFALVDVLVEIAQEHGVEPSTIAIAWMLAQGVTAPIASASSASQVDGLIKAATMDLHYEDIERLEDASAPLTLEEN